MFSFGFKDDDIEDDAGGDAFEATGGDIPIPRAESVEPKCHDLETLVSRRWPS